MISASMDHMSHNTISIINMAHMASLIFNNKLPTGIYRILQDRIHMKALLPIIATCHWPLAVA